MATRIEPVQGVLKVKAAATGNLTLSGAQTIDTSASCVAGDLVLAHLQTTGAERAVYVVAVGAWTLVDPGASDGLLIEVLQGDTLGDHTFKVTTASVWGTDTPTFVDQGAGGGTLNTLTGDLLFSKEANHVIYVAASTTNATTGGSLSSVGGAGSAAGASVAAGAGGGANTTGGVGGAGSATNAGGTGGATQIKGGVGGAASAAQAAGVGGAVSVVGGAAGSVSLGGAGNDGGALNLDGGVATGAGTAGAVSIGASNTTSIAMGRTPVVLAITAKTSTVTQGVSTTGSPYALKVIGGAHTTLTASTEANDLYFNLARTVQFSTGALTTQRAVYIDAPTYGAVAATTITNAATFAISGAPVAGTNATITNKLAFWVQGGSVNLGDGTIAQGTNINTDVTVDTASGVITTQSASTAAVTAETGFTVTCAACRAGSVVIARVVAYSGTLMTNGIPEVHVDVVSAGSFHVKVMNLHAVNALSGTMKIHYAVL